MLQPQKGAKILGSNKEAKSASNILSKDKDKYLRNKKIQIVNWTPPCLVHKTLRNLQTGWDPPTAHPVSKFNSSWQPDKVASGSQLTHWMTPPPVHPVLFFFTFENRTVRFSNFKKIRIGWLHSGVSPETTKIHQNKKFYISVVPCHR